MKGQLATTTVIVIVIRFEENIFHHESSQTLEQGPERLWICCSSEILKT